MFEYRQVMTRMRLGDTDRAIARVGLMGRRKVAQLRRTAAAAGWLDVATPLPGDPDLAVHLGSVRTQPAVASLAEPHRERITRWWRQGVQGTTIHGAPVRSHGFTGSYSSVRRFLAGVQAPETLQGAFLGIVAGNRRGQPFRRRTVYGFAGGRAVGDEACGRGFHPVPSMGQLLEFVEEGAEGVAAIVSPYPYGGVVQSQGAIAARVSPIGPAACLSGHQCPAACFAREHIPGTRRRFLSKATSAPGFPLGARYRTNGIRCRTSAR